VPIEELLAQLVDRAHEVIGAQERLRRLLDANRLWMPDSRTAAASTFAERSVPPGPRPDASSSPRTTTMKRSSLPSWPARRDTC
jgi:hypothetical protein